MGNKRYVDVYVHVSFRGVCRCALKEGETFEDFLHLDDKRIAQRLEDLDPDSHISDDDISIDDIEGPYEEED